MAPSKPKSQKYHLKWPWNPTQVGYLDEMLQEIFTSLSSSVSSALQSPVGPANGGTGLTSFSIGDLLYASAAAVLSRLPFVSTPTRYLSNTGAGVPAWDQINLTNGVKNRLPYANVVGATAASLLVGRGAGSGAGDLQEVTLGSNLSMSGTVLNAASGGGGGSGTTPIVASVATSVTAGNGMVVTESLEIAAGIILEIEGGARLEITGQGLPDFGYISISREGTPAGAQNLSTLGTRDWFVPNGSGSNPTQTAAQHTKFNGGWIFRSFDFLLNGATIGTLASTVTISTNGSDDCSAALSAVTPTCVAPSQSTGVICGWKFRVPTSSKTRVLRIYAPSFNSVVQISAVIDGNVFPLQTYTTRGIVNSITRDDVYKIVFSGNGGDLIVTATNQSTGLAGASNPRVGLAWAILSDT